MISKLIKTKITSNVKTQIFDCFFLYANFECDVAKHLVEHLTDN